MHLYSEFRQMVGRRDALGVEQLLANIPSPVSGGFGHVLLEVMGVFSPEISWSAAEKLAAMPHGIGMTFLIEALTIPDLPIASAVIELLEINRLGTGWGRLPKILSVLGPTQRRHLVERLLEHRSEVPTNKWRVLVCAAEPGVDLELMVETLWELTKCQLPALGPECRAQRLLEHAIADAFVMRMERNCDPPKVQTLIAEALVKIAERHRFISRRLMRMLIEGETSARSMVLLAALSKSGDTLIHGHIDAAVPSFVALACSDDTAAALIALETLKQITSQGTPTDWLPLLKCSLPGARATAMLAFESVAGDIGAALPTLMSSESTEERVRTVNMVGHRLLKGHKLGADAMQSFIRRVATDEDISVADQLDVASLLRHSDGLSRYCATVELLRTPHDRLLGRCLSALEEPEVWREVRAAAQPRLLVTAFVDALSLHDCDGEQERLDRLVHLLSLLDPSQVIRELNDSLPMIGRRLCDFLVAALSEIPDDDWRRQRATYLEWRDAASPARLPRLGRTCPSWVLLSALRNPNVEVRIAGLKSVRRFDRPLITEIGGLLESEEEHRTALAALARIVHPASIGVLEKRLPTSPEAIKLAAAMRTKLEILEGEPFAWPEGHKPPHEKADLDTHALWLPCDAFRPSRSSWWRRFWERRDAQPIRIGRVALSSQAWWHRDYRRDEVVTWSDPFTIELYQTLEESAGGICSVELRLEQVRPFGRVEVGASLWVAPSMATSRLPKAARRYGYLAMDDTRRFLSTLTYQIERSNSAPALASLIARLSARPSLSVSRPME